MKVLIVLMACLAYAAAECGPLQRLKVKHQWAEAYGSHGLHREELGREMWHYVFEHAPKSKDLFSNVRGDNVYSVEFSAHMVRVLGGLDMCISLLNDHSTLDAQLAHLSQQHKDMGIPNEYFDVLKAGLLETLPHHVSHNSHFDQDAWSHCFDVIASGIKH
nr:haemoglobin A5 chain [Arenicola marina]